MKNQFRWIIVVLLFVIWLASVSSAVSGEIYKWKDKDGNIIFSDTPPPPGVDVEVKENINLPRPKSESFREKRSYSDIQVIMYMTPWCPYCVKAREYLRSLDVNLVEHNIERDKSKREEMLSKSGGSSGVPLVDIEGIIIRGYNPDAFRGAIERRRSL